MAKTTPQGANRLIHEKSPYLLQHAYNPVDWYPWSAEALMRAKAEEKPILLSIGYSTCHWCHVMERESFSDAEIARLMNTHFVCIKLDREERPDLDQIYITAVSALHGSAGWPLNVFLTPDLKPFYGGTYFPPRRRPGMPSWKDILELLANAWNDPGQREKILNSAGKIHAVVQNHLRGNPVAAPLDAALLDDTFHALEAQYDSTWGGFSPAPKFPLPSVSAFLFFYHARFREKGKKDSRQGRKALEMVLFTLKCMAKGGIFDPIGGGFHRYATDGKWRIPHFEKMLYDNAQLASTYLTAFQITRDPFFKAIAEMTLDWVSREMTHPGGGFFSALDADSLPSEKERRSPIPGAGEKREGVFYVWTLPEIIDILGETEAALFSHRYGVQPAGNAELDPHGAFFGKNILFQAHTLEETARTFQISKAAARTRLDAARTRLLDVRNRRPAPHLDDKIITAWNGLMISAWARAYQILEKPFCLQRAIDAAEFIWNALYDRHKSRLFRIWRKNERKIHGMAEDYAACIQGFIDLYEADFDLKWLERAETLGRILLEDFFDNTQNGFFMNPASETEPIGIRIKEIHDGVIPSAASMAALALFRLYQYTRKQAFFNTANAAVESVVPTLRQHPAAAPLMLTAADFILEKSLQILIFGNPEDAATREMARLARDFYHPTRTVIWVDSPRRRREWAKRIPFIAHIPLEDHGPKAYLCVDQRCSLPVEDPEALKALLPFHDAA